MEFPPYFGRNFTKTIHSKPSAAIDPSKVTLPKGFVVVVTGAGKGIGKHIAQAYAKARASTIIITSRTASDLDKLKSELEAIASEQGHIIDVVALPGDASTEALFQQIRTLLETKYSGRLDVLINNAGAIGSMESFTDDITKSVSADTEQVTGVNYLGPYYAMKQLIPLMTAPPSTGKTILNISSEAAHMTSLGPLAYVISKIALTRMSQYVGENHASDGIVCIALHPGGVLSDGATRTPQWLQDMLTDDADLCGAVAVWLSKEPRLWASGRWISATCTYLRKVQINLHGTGHKLTYRTFALGDMDELEAMKEDIVSNDKLKFRMVV